MSAFEKILKLELDFDNRKVELLELRNHRIREIDEEIKLKREKLQGQLKSEVEQIRAETEIQVKKMQAELAKKLAEDQTAFNLAFQSEKEKIVEQIFIEVKKI